MENFRLSRREGSKFHDFRKQWIIYKKIDTVLIKTVIILSH